MVNFFWLGTDDITLSRALLLSNLCVFNVFQASDVCCICKSITLLLPILPCKMHRKLAMKPWKTKPFALVLHVSTLKNKVNGMIFKKRRMKVAKPGTLRLRARWYGKNWLEI